MKRYAIAILLGASCFMQGVTSAQDSRVSIKESTAYQLQTGDTVEVIYRLTPEFNQVVTVQPDGSITLQLLGSIPVRGLPLSQVRDLVQQAASKRLRNPELAIELKDYDKPHFTVLGEVGTPGRYELRGPLTVEDGVALAGGFKVAARHTNIVLIHRNISATGEIQKIDFKALDHPKPGMELVNLRPGDIIVVPTSKLSKVERYVRVFNTGIFYNPAF